MSDLFHTGQSRRTSGAFSVTMRDGAKLAKKLTKEQATEVKAILRKGSLSQVEIAAQYGVTKALISNINRGRSWKHVV